MEYRIKLIVGMLCAVFLAGLSTPVPVVAKSLGAEPDQHDKQQYIVVLKDPSLAAYDGRLLMTPERDIDSTRLPATANSFTGAKKLDVYSPESQQYLQFLDERFDHFRGTAALELGRQLDTVHRYRNAVNGFATLLSAAEAEAIRALPNVEDVALDVIQHMQTDSGPNWIGAKEIQMGNSGFAATGGEGVVIGIIDSGVNYTHPSFSDLGEGIPPGQGDWDHVNPYPAQLGLCSDEAVKCNDKLVGVYDFVQDDPATTDVVEENNNGLDNTGHGSHVASTAAGNPRAVADSNGLLLNIAGVAPNANIVSYRVCFLGDPDDPDDDGCQTSAILSAIDQAITDKVDVINYSVGSSAVNPWHAGSTALAYLNARAAGIFVATSAGNAGPNPGTMGSPGNAPWITAVGSATHDRLFGSLVRQMSGGATAPPPELIGASFSGGIGVTKIVHARDFGNALCGVGTAELQPDCDSNTGASNPFAPGTFNGEIVVCDRGEYGRVEKGKNLLLAGAGGYILANTDAQGESIIADNHCLPATHVGAAAGNQLRTWLASGNGHEGSMTGVRVLHRDSVADEISSFSSRGPNLPPVENVLKPDIIAPGSSILAAYVPNSGSYAFLSGTSMASPHVTGGAALIKAVHPNWSPAKIASALVMTATPELAKDFDGSNATPHKRGSGRPRLDIAVNAALYLDETENDFRAADPGQGGDPKGLNLPGMVDTVCRNSCSFSRRVADLVGGASWKAKATGFPAGVAVSVSPSSFTLASGASRLLTVDIDLSNSGIVGSWVYGEVRLSSGSHPDAVLTVAVFADGGELPTEWTISSDDISGWQEFSVSGLAAMPDATYTSGGLVIPTETVANLPQDPTNDSPYDDSAGLLTLSINVPPDTLWLHTETLKSTSKDLDLFIGLDANNDGIAQASEELCASTSPTELELCDLFAPVAGNYWAIVQNWQATNTTDKVTLKTAVVGKNTLSRLYASGNGIVASGASQTVRVSWDNVSALPGTELIGAVGIGTRRESPNNIGIIPVKFTKTAAAAPKTLVLMDGVSRGLTVKGNDMHNLAYIDIPAGADSLTVAAAGADGVQSDNLVIELYRMSFAAAFASVPFAATPNTAGNPIATGSGGGGSGPSVTVSGNPLSAGRWYVVVKNGRASDAAVEVKADVSFAGSPIPLRAGLWKPSSRPDLSQGFDYAASGTFRAFIWYTYDENGQPDWYLASAPVPDGNIWVADLIRFTNDGTLQQENLIGHVSITTLAENDNIFSWVLYGQNGSERMSPTAAQTCPMVSGSPRSRTGLWSRKAIGVGGASGLVNSAAQAFIHFIYDDDGRPRWLLAAPDDNNQSPTTTQMPLLQFKGYCAVCAEKPVTSQSAGLFTRNFVDEENLTWTLDYAFLSPLKGSVNRTDDTEKLTVRLDCQ